MRENLEVDIQQCSHGLDMVNPRSGEEDQRCHLSPNWIDDRMLVAGRKLRLIMDGQEDILLSYLAVIKDLAPLNCSKEKKGLLGSSTNSVPPSITVAV